MPSADRWAFTGAQVSASGLTVPVKSIERQMRYLNSLPKMTRDQLARLIAGKAMPPQLLPPEPKAEPVVRPHGWARIPHPRPHSHHASHSGAQQCDPVPILRRRGARPQRR